MGVSRIRRKRPLAELLHRGNAAPPAGAPARVEVAKRVRVAAQPALRDSEVVVAALDGGAPHAEVAREEAESEDDAVEEENVEEDGEEMVVEERVVEVDEGVDAMEEAEEAEGEADAEEEEEAAGLGA